MRENDNNDVDNDDTTDDGGWHTMRLAIARLRRAWDATLLTFATTMRENDNNDVDNDDTTDDDGWHTMRLAIAGGDRRTKRRRNGWVLIGARSLVCSPTRGHAIAAKAEAERGRRREEEVRLAMVDDSATVSSNTSEGPSVSSDPSVDATPGPQLLIYNTGYMEDVRVTMTEEEQGGVGQATANDDSESVPIIEMPSTFLPETDDSTPYVILDTEAQMIIQTPSPEEVRRHMLGSFASTLGGYSDFSVIL